MDFFKVALSMHIYVLYGLTETSGPVTITLPGDRTSGHIGGPISTSKIRLRDVPELGYSHADDPPRGEVQAKTSHSFKGYFKQPEKTKETIDDCGWVSTGDVGMILPNGAI